MFWVIQFIYDGMECITITAVCNIKQLSYILMTNFHLCIFKMYIYLLNVTGDHVVSL